jgi:hypothetical protein
MKRGLLFTASVLLFLHGLVHLMGTAAYLRLAEVQGLPYKTTLLGGRWEVSELGIGLFGVLWAVAAVGFILSALLLFFRLPLKRPVLLWTTLLSLVLTVLDWEVAKVGAMVNLTILAILGRQLLGRAPTLSAKQEKA